MVTSEKKVPFPQANDFNKILKIIDYCSEDDLKNKNYLMELINVSSSRQVDYYINACRFLDIINQNNFTDFGKSLKMYSYESKIVNLCSSIIKLPVFGEVYLRNYLYGEDLNIDNIAQLISLNYNISNLNVCIRRASTVKNWISWIIEKKKESELWN